ncbi:MAG: DUF5320 domain-containing protein [Syntrophaceticus schinkii]|jgi:hypothetical protein|nr:DUF5320 domain-containing protein [Syntrophaceticus schinkii]
MMRGREYYGPGFWKGGPGPAWGGRGRGQGRGLGRGNPSPFCRFFPWLPRRWWAASGGVPGPRAAAPEGVPGPWAAAPTQGEEWNEADVLKEQASFIQQRLNEINKRLEELEGQE